MTQLSFDLLDRHVVDGRGDDIACTDASGSLTFAQLLEKSAAIGGGLTILGVRPGDVIDVQLTHGNDRVLAACALIRLGALPGAGGRVWIGPVDDVPTVRVSEPEHAHSHELSLVERAGRSDAAAALTTDPPGYAERLRAAFPDIVEPLLTGSPVV